MKRHKRKNPKYHSSGDSQFTHDYNSAGANVGSGPWAQRGGLEFNFGGGLPPEQHLSIGHKPYGNIMMARGGRVKYDGGGSTGSTYAWDFGNPNATQYNAPKVNTYNTSPDQTVNQPISTPQYVPQNTNSYSGTNAGNYLGYAGTALNAYNSYNAASKNSGVSKGENTASGVNAGINSVAGSVLPWYGLAQTASGIGKSTLKTNDQGQLASSTERQANNAMTPVHETAINHFGQGDWKAGVGTVLTGGISDNAAEVFGLNPNSMRKKQVQSPQYNQQDIMRGIDANYNDSYLAGSHGIANGDTNYSRMGGRIKAQYADGGNMRRIPGGIMAPRGNGIETAVGRSHEAGGMQYSPDSEIQGGEQVLDGNYVLTNEPGSEPRMETSISKRFNKNLNAISKRNSRDDIDSGTQKLKEEAIMKNEEYLAGENEKLNAAMDRVIKKYGGHLEDDCPECDQEMKKGGNMNYQIGNTYDVSDEELMNLQNQGYKIKIH